MLQYLSAFLSACRMLSLAVQLARAQGESKLPSSVVMVFFQAIATASELQLCHVPLREASRQQRSISAVAAALRSAFHLVIWGVNMEHCWSSVGMHKVLGTCCSFQDEPSPDSTESLVSSVGAVMQ